MAYLKSTFPLCIGTPRLYCLFKESPCSPVVTFPSFGSEGHGVQPLQGDSFFIFVLDFTYVFFLGTMFLIYFLNQLKQILNDVFKMDLTPGWP